MNNHSLSRHYKSLSKISKGKTSKLKMKNKVNKFWNVIRIIMAIFMVFGGIQHLIKPDFYLPFVPDFLCFKMSIIYISGAGEIIVGLLLLTKKYRGFASLLLLMMMLAFLPIHLWDVFSDAPAIGSHKAALIRLPVQFLFIAITWKLQKIYFKK